MTVFEDLGERLLDKYMAHEGLAAALSKARSNLKKGHYGYWKDIVFQEWERFGDGCSLENTACYLEIHTGIFLGNIAIAEINVGEEPSEDKDARRNNEILRNLSEINCLRIKDSDETQDASCEFSGEFWGGHGIDHDGVVSWNGKCHFTVFHRDGKTKHNIFLDSRTVELEVGYTKGYRTLHHLMLERGLARWPYGSKSLYILSVVNKDLWRVNIPYSGRSKAQSNQIEFDFVSGYAKNNLQVTP